MAKILVADDSLYGSRSTPLAVDVSPVPDAGNGDFLLLVVYPVESPVVANPEAVALPAGELYGVRRMRVLFEG